MPYTEESGSALCLCIPHGTCVCVRISAHEDLYSRATLRSWEDLALLPPFLSMKKQHFLSHGDLFSWPCGHCPEVCVLSFIIPWHHRKVGPNTDHLECELHPQFHEATQVYVMMLSVQSLQWQITGTKAVRAL